ncbi:hypothetical protein FHS96_005107 [Sphingomonas zeicaulis]|uniref:aldehyde dehydrogenase family protein n=1 Tax=Sphingomonas zeicaulis TaxID=1632740 RepID=UPI003D240BA1
MTNFPARNWINGAFAAPMALSPSINPATCEPIGSYADDGATATRDAVDAAATAFRRTPWAHDAELRARVLDQMADAMERRRERLIAILARERQDPERGSARSRRFAKQAALLGGNGSYRGRARPAATAGKHLDRAPTTDRSSGRRRALEFVGRPRSPVVRTGAGRRLQPVLIFSALRSGDSSDIAVCTT